MKKQFLWLQIGLSLFAAVVVLYFAACNKGKVADEVTQQKTTGSHSDALASGGCYFPVILEYYTVGRSAGTYCMKGTGLCHVTKIVNGNLAPCPVFKLPDCQVVDCGNPWNYGNIGYPPDYEKYFPNNPLESAFVPIKVTPTIAILQFYAEIKGTLDSKTLTLPASFSLTKDVAKNVGLAGDMVPAGTYPVNYDAKNKTLNAIVSVK